MTKPIDIDRAEHIVFQKGGVPASIQRAITRDPKLPDGPYRTLHLYAEYARNEDAPSIQETAETRGKSPRTLFKHRQTLIKLGYIEIARDDDGSATVTVCNPARISRLKKRAATLPTSEHRPTPENEAALLLKLKRIRPDFHAAGGRKLLRAYHGETPIDELLDQWIAARDRIPAGWRVGMVYREIEAGNPPPAPAAIDSEWAEIFEYTERQAAKLVAEEDDT